MFAIGRFIRFDKAKLIEVCQHVNAPIFMPEFQIILIVDDDPDDRELFSEAVGMVNRDIQVKEAKNGEEALAVLNAAETLPDYIFMDLNMPRMDGKQCLKKIKASPLLQNIPVIIYTTSKLQVDIEETAKYGVTYFITKPSRFTELKEAIEFVLENKWRRS